MSQDLPPVGGYEPIQYRRNVPPRGFKPRYYLFGVLGIVTYGFYKAIGGIQEQRELMREKLWARIYLIPVMQAETDRDLVRRVWAAEKREEFLMKDVKGWKMGSVYHSDRFVRPTYSVTPGVVTEGDLPHAAYPEWKDLTPEQQERMAANNQDMLNQRLDKMTPQEKERFYAKVKLASDAAQKESASA